MRIKSGFTLVELVVVIIIVAILVARSVPAFQDRRTEAEASAIIRNVTNFHNAAGVYLAEHGALPQDANRGAFPTDLDGYISSSIFETQVGDGGTYDWDGPGGYTSRRGLSVVYPDGTHVPSLKTYRAIERMLDDGARDTGFVTCTSLRIIFHFDP